MMASMIARRMPLAALFAMALTGSPAAAQDDPASAARLTNEAMSLYSSPVQFGRAAELHLEAAALRSADDPRRVQDLAAAARLLVYAGDVARGREIFEKAAQTALVAGDLVTAGNFYVDAAFVALQGSDESEARKMLRAARWVAGAPMLTGEDQRMILRRFTGDAQ